MVIFEEVTEEVADNRGVTSPQRCRHDVPGKEPLLERPLGSAAGQGHQRAPARDETSSDEQQPASFVNLRGCFRHLFVAIAVLTSHQACYPRTKPLAQGVSNRIAKECPNGTHKDHEQQQLIALPSGDTSDDHGGLAGHDRDNGVQKSNDEDHQDEPPSRRYIAQPFGQTVHYVEHTRSDHRG